MGRSVQMKRGMLAALLFGMVSSSALAGVQVKEPARTQQAQRDVRVEKATPGDEPQNTGAIIIWLQNWMQSHLKR